MKVIKKILSVFLAFTLLVTVMPLKVEAASGSVSISSNKSQVVVGNSVTFTVKVSSSVGMVALQYAISYDDSMLSLTSGSKSGAPVFDSSTKSKTYSFTFKAKKSGTAKFSFQGTGAAWEGDNEISFASKSKSVKIITQEELQASYSSNNYLSSLSIDNYALSPKFSKDVNSYTVNVDANTTSVRIRATKSDSSASVSGVGNISVKDGLNRLTVRVTAENGSTRTYTINVTVKELKPINVKVDDQDYTVVRKSNELKSPSDLFKASTIKIGEDEVPALSNSNESLFLIGLKDTDGNIKLFMYDDGEYKPYNGFTFNTSTLSISDQEIKGMDKTTITIDDKEVTAYQAKNDKDYAYFYATNVENNETNVYKYDLKEKTVQRYSEIKPEIEKEEEKDVTNNDDIKLYKYIIIGLTALLILTYLVILINLIRAPSKKKKKLEDMDELDKINEELEYKEKLKEEISVKIDDEDIPKEEIGEDQAEFNEEEAVSIEDFLDEKPKKKKKKKKKKKDQDNK